jgi:hypothetical protein
VSYPSKSDPAYDYEGFQESQPATPLPADHVVVDFANLKTASDATIDFLKLFATSEGRILAAAAPGGEDLTAYVATATAAATAASASQTAAASSATAAAASATTAAATAGSIVGTATDSVAIATGSKSFTTQTAKNFAVGAWATIASAADVTNFMFGQVTAYNSGTGALTVNVTSVGGSGTHSDWTISVSGVQGVKGDKGDTGPAGSGGTDATGVVKFFTGRIAEIPSGWLPLNGATGKSRATYSDLVAVWIKSSTFTVTIASPAVVSKTAHGLDDGDPWVASTTGALPTGITAGTTYYVVAIGANSFSLAATPGGAAINTTGSQSGTHTYVSALCGVGDGSTTFDMPDWRGTTPIGHDMMGSTAADNLTNANEGIYGRSNGKIGGANHDAVVNTLHNHSGTSPVVTGTSGALYASNINNADPTLIQFNAVTGIGAGGGTTGSSGTASAQYKRVGRVATGIWMVKT